LIETINSELIINTNLTMQSKSF